MNKIELLKIRKNELYAVGSEIRKQIDLIVDEASFVELETFSFSKNDYYGEEREGEGVVTGYATIEDSPVYIVAQNSKVLSGGLSKANCDKITRCIHRACENSTPIIYLLDSEGVQVGEGVSVLEGVGNVTKAMMEARGITVQVTLVLGNVYGSTSLMTACSDFNFMLEKSNLSYASPFVISASSKVAVKTEDISGVNSGKYNGLVGVKINSMDEFRDNLVKLFSILPQTSCEEIDCEDDLNRVSPALNENVNVNSIIEATFDKGTFVELNQSFESEVITGIARVGGISVASVIFKDGEGVELTLNKVLKIKNFVNFAMDNEMPMVNFVNSLGIKTDVQTNNSPILLEIANLVYSLSNINKLSVVYGKAIGLGYTLFSSKGMGNSVSFAFANSKISLFDGLAGAIEFGDVSEDKLSDVKEKYADENQDPMNSAMSGYVDNIIEPEFVRQYVISALQMITR